MSGRVRALLLPLEGDPLPALGVLTKDELGAVDDQLPVEARHDPRGGAGLGGALGGLPRLLGAELEDLPGAEQLEADVEELGLERFFAPLDVTT